MNTAQAGDLIENLSQYNRLRFFRKHLYRFLHVFVATIVGFQVEDAVVWIPCMAVSPETVGYMDHDQGQIRRIRDSRGRDIHEVFQAPVLFGIPKVKLDLEPQPIIVYEWCIRQGQVTAEQLATGTSPRIGTSIREVQRRIVPELGNEV